KQGGHSQQRNYTPLIWVLSVVAVILILGVNYLPRSTDGTIAGIDLTLLPLVNAILNGIAFLLLIEALVTIKRKNIKAHRRFIIATFCATCLFFITYLTYHALAGSTSYGGNGIILYIYYIVVLTHIIVETVLFPLALITLN